MLLSVTQNATVGNATVCCEIATHFEFGHYRAMLDWDDFRYFSAVAHAGSVRGAARELGVHASTVTRRLEQFEKQLGIRLFARTPGGLIITPEGEDVVRTLDDIAARLQAVERRLRGHDGAMAGVVRINVPEVFGSALFMAEIGELRRRHPDVVVEVHRSWQPPDLDKREGDLSVVLTDEPPGHLIGRPVGRMTLVAYCGSDTTPDVEQHWLASALEAAVAPGYAKRIVPAPRISGYLASVELQLAAVLAGMGSTLLPAHVGSQHAQLRRVSVTNGVNAELRLGIWLLSHPDSRGVARVQAVSELMLGALRGYEPGYGPGD